MNAPEIIWTIILALSFIAFFGIAAIVTVKGLGDIMELLSHLDKSKHAAFGRHIQTGSSEPPANGV